MKKKYQNMSGERLVIDCISSTIYMEPGSILALPVSRDVRLNVRLRKLVPIREIREELTKPAEPIKPVIKKNWKEKIKPELIKDKQDKMETE